MPPFFRNPHKIKLCYNASANDNCCAGSAAGVADVSRLRKRRHMMKLHLKLKIEGKPFRKNYTKPSYFERITISRF